STVSQLGYMFLAMGVGAYTAGIFHLFTHAFFKALLFLGSGAVIHALAGEQDLRRMGGLKRELPITYWTFVIGAVAIAGVPGLAGFFSKDEILYRTFASGHTVLWVTGVVTSLLTAIYMFRLVHLAFHGERAHAPGAAAGHAAPATPDAAAGHGHGHLHDAPPAMALALIVLAAGSIFAGYVGVPPALGGSNRIEQFLEPSFTVAAEAGSPAASHEESAGEHRGLELGLMGVSSVVAVGGIAIATFFFLWRRRSADEMALRFSGLHRLLSHKYYVDETYESVVIQPIRIAAEEGLWKVVDARIDGSVNGVAGLVSGGSDLLRRVQTGSVRVYAAAVMLGVVVIVGYYVWR
ncbi:MAG: proton-conducting transporter membrane subunit, partial [Acidobacteriota bacterium]